jgi:hypothetical protein
MLITIVIAASIIIVVLVAPFILNDLNSDEEIDLNDQTQL